MEDIASFWEEAYGLGLRPYVTEETGVSMMLLGHYFKRKTVGR